MADDQSQPLRFCRSCLYALRVGDSRRCPECGKEFDPNDPRTTLTFPHFRYWEHLATIARVLIRASIVLMIVSFVLCMLGFDRPRVWHYLSCGFGIGLVVVTTTLAAIPKVPLRRRLRICGLICPMLFTTIDWTHWPLLASVYVCPPWVNMIAGHAIANGHSQQFQQPPWRKVRRGCELSNGTIGFELLAGDGGGIFLVRSAGPIGLGPNRVWYNTNWEKHIGGKWFVVYYD